MRCNADETVIVVESSTGRCQPDRERMIFFLIICRVFKNRKSYFLSFAEFRRIPRLPFFFSFAGFQNRKCDLLFPSHFKNIEKCASFSIFAVLLHVYQKINNNSDNFLLILLLGLVRSAMTGYGTSAAQPGHRPFLRLFRLLRRLRVAFS